MTDTRPAAYLVIFLFLSMTAATSGCSLQQKILGKSGDSVAWKDNDKNTAEAVSTVPQTGPANQSAPITGDNTRYYLQPVAYTNRANAEKMQKTLKGELKYPVVIFEEVDDGKTYFKIQIGPFNTLQDAVKAERDVMNSGFEKLRYIRR